MSTDQPVPASSPDSPAGGDAVGSGAGPADVGSPVHVSAFRVLFVCTANICRSASAEHLLRSAVADDPRLAGIEVRSAGTAAVPGAPGCTRAASLSGHAGEHRSQRLTADLLTWADLVLPAARDHREPIMRLAPSVRPRTFTIRQVARIADWAHENDLVALARQRAAAAWVDRFPPGDPRAAVAPLPAAQAQRWAWLLGELDAARGLVPAPVDGLADAGGARSPGRRGVRRLSGRGAGRDRVTAPRGEADAGVHPDDVPDPHVLGMALHEVSDAQIRAAVASLVALLTEVAR